MRTKYSNWFLAAYLFLTPLARATVANKSLENDLLKTRQVDTQVLERVCKSEQETNLALLENLAITEESIEYLGAALNEIEKNREREARRVYLKPFQEVNEYEDGTHERGKYYFIDRNDRKGILKLFFKQRISPMSMDLPKPNAVYLRLHIPDKKYAGTKDEIEVYSRDEKGREVKIGSCVGAKPGKYLEIPLQVALLEGKFIMEFIVKVNGNDGVSISSEETGNYPMLILEY